MSEARRIRGTAARLSGRKAELWAAALLMLKGYRILGFRLRTTAGEIDLVALRGKTLAIVEVKQRATIEAALEAVGYTQRERLRRAGRSLAARRRGLADAFVRLDLIALAPGRLPRHIVDAWRFDDSAT
jgi:putative endonuclease